MEYTQEVADHSTGEIETVSLGNWITITEYGRAKDTGPRQVRDVLSHLGILHDEIEDMTPKDAPFTERKLVKRRRLTPKAIRQGLGKRLFSVAGRPFDVLSPKGQEWIDGKWDDAALTIKTDIASSPTSVTAKAALEGFMSGRRRRLDPEGQCRWLLDHFRDLAQVEISRIIEASERMVSHYVQRRADQIRKAGKRKVLPLGDRSGFRQVPDIIDPRA